MGKGRDRRRKAKDRIEKAEQATLEGVRRKEAEAKEAKPEPKEPK